MFLLYMLCFTWIWQTSIGISVKLEPKENHVVNGGTAVFTCTVTGRNRRTEFILLRGILDDKSEWTYFPTNFIKVHYFNQNSSESLNHTVVYSANSKEEVFELHVSNVTTGRNLIIECLAGSVHDEAILRVWILPTSEPQCNFKGELPPIIQDGQSYPINLTCSLKDGDPQPPLSWYKVHQNQFELIEGPHINSLTTTQFITASDHDREYTCQARIEAMPHDPLFCTVIPYQPKPEICVSFKTQRLFVVAAIGWCSFIILLIVFVYCLKHKFVCYYAAIPKTSVDNENSYTDLQQNDISRHTYASPSVYVIQSVKGPAMS